MKKSCLVLVFFGLSASFAKAQQDTLQNQNILYTLFINVVPDQFSYPLVGFINVAKGSHHNLQLGFVNTTERNFAGPQFGFVNTVGGTTHGVQYGFVNTTGSDVYGAQFGFVNTAGQTLNGAQFGFVNTAGNKLNGLQYGFVNTSGGNTKGAQIGFVNTTHKILHGLQFGFVNVVDSVADGVPIGFISVVKKGGYSAVELGITEMYPINLSYKIGLERFYTTLVGSYGPQADNEFALGAGFGSIFRTGKSTFFNPELISQNVLTSGNRQMVSFVANFGYEIMPNLQLIGGPSLVWNYADQGSPLNDPFFSVYTNDLNSDRNQLIVGLRLALRYVF